MTHSTLPNPTNYNADFYRRMAARDVIANVRDAVTYWTRAAIGASEDTDIEKAERYMAIANVYASELIRRMKTERNA